LTGHAEPDHTDSAGALRHRLHMIAGGEDVFAPTSTLCRAVADRIVHHYHA
jgi:hypothetical protein